MTLDEELVQSVDKIVKDLHTSRSAFTRKALQEAIERHNDSLLELKHRAGYEKKPVSKREFSVWDKEQVWVEE